MSFTAELLSGLEKNADFCRIREAGKYITGSLRLPASEYSKVLRHLEKKLKPILKNGEKIVSNISHGEIIDCGIKQFRIKKGVIMEVYDYSRMTSIFIRVYIISGDDEGWLALYIDENPSTPWWSRRED